AWEHTKAAEILIPGIEVSAIDGPHLLIYVDTLRDLASYYDESVKGHQGACPHMATDLPTEKIVREAKESSGLVIAAHPYGYAMLVRGVLKAIEIGMISPEVLDRIDGLEVICGGLSHPLNTRAEEYAAAHNFSMTGGSDAHTLREVGRAVTSTDETLTPAEFLEAVRHQKTDVIGCERGTADNLLMGTQVMTKYVPYLPSGIAMHIRQGKMRLRR
ncbi:MAG: phosphotransferase, partial [Methanocalculaceae archaeon]|nr:phosphotransferase [Methanocalculaceae archaeon]